MNITHYSAKNIPSDKLLRFFAVLLFALLLGLLFLAAHVTASANLAGVLERVSVASTGEEGNSWSGGYSISADGRFVAFCSRASNLVSGDTNGVGDVFVRDLQTGVTERVSVSSTGEQADDHCIGSSISADGRFVVFISEASNLVSGDTSSFCDNNNDGLAEENCYEIFVHDRQTGETEMVSVATNGEPGNNHSLSASISADGRTVAFGSWADNLVSEDTNGWVDIFIHDRQTGVTERVSVSSSGTQGNSPSHDHALSADGRYVAFYSTASNLVSGDTNNMDDDVFVHDRQTGETELVSVSSTGEQGNRSSSQPSLSADGRYVAFSSWASNLVEGDLNLNEDIYVHDRQTGETERIPDFFTVDPGNWWSISPAISADGRYVAYQAASFILHPEVGIYPTWYDVFVYDRQTGITEWVSMRTTGEAGNGNSYDPTLSADGRYVAFGSGSSNLVAGDTNFTCDLTWDEVYEENCPDVFVYDRCPNGECANPRFYLPVITR